MLYDLYKYDEWHELLYDNNTFTCSCNLTDNRPMNQRVVKLHKGVDNEVKFRVFDSDRKRAKIEHLRVSVVLISTENQELVLKTTGKIMPQKGTFNVIFNESDLTGISPGYYNLVITGEEWAVPEQPGDIIATPFYTDTIANIDLTALVIDSAEKQPIPTTTVYAENPQTGLSDWICTNEIIDGVYTRLYHSSPIQGNRIKNYRKGTHTFAITCEEFNGRFEARGSLEHIPPTRPQDYFPLNLTNFSTYAEYGIIDPETDLRIPFTGIDPFTFTANVMWIMFVWVPTDSKGVPIDENHFPKDWSLPVKRLQVRS